MTKREMFTAIRAIVVDNDEMVAFIDREIELLDKKSATPRKATKTQLENANFKAEILSYLIEIDKPVTIKEMQGAIPGFAELSNQRITHMLTDLRKEEKIVRDYVKKTPYFSIATTETA